MKKYLLCMAVALLIPIAQAEASNVGVSVGINVGAPVAPVYVAPPVAIAAPPLFLAPPRLGFYVAVGVPFDLFYVSGNYFLLRGNTWYSSPYYNGPWVVSHYSKVPYGIRKHPVHRIHYYRDNYYKNYQSRGGHDYRHFRPEHRDYDRRGHDDGRHGKGRGGDHGRGWDDRGKGWDDHGRRGR